MIAERFLLNSRQLRTICQIWMYLLYGSLHDESYDFGDVVEEDMVEIAKLLSYESNPYINKELENDFVKDNADLNMHDEEVKKSIFTMSFLLLGRIHDSIDFWEKKLGSNGYLTYLSDVEAYI